MVREEGRLRGVEAVLDKDLTGALLARTVNADTLPDRHRRRGRRDRLRHAGAGVARRGRRQNGSARCCAQGEFGGGSMGPKVRAALRVRRQRRARGRDHVAGARCAKASRARPGRSGAGDDRARDRAPRRLPRLGDADARLARRRDRDGDEVSVGMATPLNLELLADQGFSDRGRRPERPRDRDPRGRRRGDRGRRGGGRRRARQEGRGSDERRAERPAARSLAAAARRDDELSMAFLSVPGRPRRATRRPPRSRPACTCSASPTALSLEVEAALKRRALERDLLFMGADCGTAIIDGVALGFANAVERGPVGIVGASGTGTQEVCCLLDAAGIGVSHAIGVGGRDLHASVGGLMMRRGLELLARRRRHAGDRGDLQAARSGRRRRDQGGGRGDRQARGARLRASHARGGGGARGRAGRRRARRAVRRRRLKRAAARKGEVRAALVQAAANVSLRPRRRGSSASGHTFIDFGDDEYTQGRAHPMIDQSLRSSTCAAGRPGAGAAARRRARLRRASRPGAELAPAIAGQGRARDRRAVRRRRRPAGARRRSGRGSKRPARSSPAATPTPPRLAREAARWLTSSDGRSRSPTSASTCSPTSSSARACASSASTGGRRSPAPRRRSRASRSRPREIARANDEAVERLESAQPHARRRRRRRATCSPASADRTLLHAGPPIDWADMSGPLRGAIVGAAVYEGLASDREDAERRAAAGEFEFGPCHERGAVGPMAGVVSPSMPMCVSRTRRTATARSARSTKGSARCCATAPTTPRCSTRLRLDPRRARARVRPGARARSASRSTCAR